MLSEVLGSSKVLWDGALLAVEEQLGSVIAEWKFYSKASGWSFVVKNKKRTILYLIPQKDFFKANFVFGDKAVDAAMVSHLLQSITDTIRDAKKNMEGRFFMIDVRNEEDGKHLKLLIKLKAEN